jgi:hypothetical protein
VIAVAASFVQPCGLEIRGAENRRRTGARTADRELELCQCARVTPQGLQRAPCR